MSSSNVKREITTISIEESFESACDSGSSSKTSNSNSELYKTALEKTSSDEFELARDHFSNTVISEYDTADDFEVTKPGAHICNAKRMQSTPKPRQEPDKKKLKTLVQTKTGTCNCTKSKQNLLANRKRKVATTAASASKTQTNDGSENLDQKYNINVPEISARYSMSGIITIPIEVRLSLKQSGHNTSGKQEDHPEEAQPVLDNREWPSIKCIYEDCSAWEYIETYMDELLDEPGGGITFGSYSQQELVFNGECTDHYAEPYHEEGYLYSENKYKLPIDWDALIPPEYYALDNDSFRKIKVSEKELTVEVEQDSPIRWEDVCLPAKGTVDIAPTPIEPDEPIAPHSIPVPEGYRPPPRRADEEETKKKKKGGFFSCCGGEDDEDDDDTPPLRKQTSIVHLKLIPKTSLIYGQHCPENEPYTRQLLKAYPHHEKSDSPCTSDTEMPWPKILLPQAVKIRPVDMIDATEVKTEPSASTNTLCLCGSNKNKSDVKPDLKKLSEPIKIPSKKSVSANDLCLCASNREQLKNLSDKLDVKPDLKNLCAANTIPSKNTVSFRDNKLVTLYPPSNLPFVQSKSNTSKPEVPMRTEPVGTIKTKLSGKSKSDDLGIMRTKVTLSGKDLNQLLKSQGKMMSSNIIKGSGNQKLSTKQICPTSNAVSSSHSAPVLPKQEPCVLETCSNIKVESKELSNGKSPHIIKADPVISALIACEAELKPVKQALNTVQQKLRNMNMPELDSIFSKGTELANVFLNKAQQNRCTCANSYGSGYNPNPTMKPANVKFMNNRMTTYARPNPSYPSSYTRPAPSSTYVPQRPRPYVEQCQFGPAPYYGQYQSSSHSQSSSCAPSVQNFSMQPNYDRNDLYPVERGPSKSAFRRPGYSNKHVKYQRDPSEDWRSADRSERICCCSSSNYSSRNRIQVRKSEDQVTITSSSSPSEDSVAKTRCPRRRHRRLVPKVKSKTSGIVSKQSLCPFLEAMKSIMILDGKKTVKRGINGVSYDTKLSTKKIKNMRMHMRVRTSKVSKK